MTELSLLRCVGRSVPVRPVCRTDGRSERKNERKRQSTKPLDRPTYRRGRTGGRSAGPSRPVRTDGRTERATDRDRWTDRTGTNRWNHRRTQPTLERANERTSPETDCVREGIDVRPSVRRATVRSVHSVGRVGLILLAQKIAYFSNEFTSFSHSPLSLLCVSR